MRTELFTKMYTSLAVLSFGSAFVACLCVGVKDDSRLGIGGGVKKTGKKMRERILTNRRSLLKRTIPPSHTSYHSTVSYHTMPDQLPPSPPNSRLATRAVSYLENAPPTSCARASSRFAFVRSHTCLGAVCGLACALVIGTRVLYGTRALARPLREDTFLRSVFKAHDKNGSVYHTDLAA